jgi:hypothetical protein
MTRKEYSLKKLNLEFHVCGQSNGKSLNTKVVRLHDSFNLDIW